MEYCTQCGAKLVDGVCPNCKGAATRANAPSKSFDSYLMNPKEKIVSVLGNNYLQNFLSGGIFMKGFSVVSDKRVYFRGKVFGIFGKKIYKTKTTSAVNIRDITGVNVTYISPIQFIITGIILILAGIILSGITHISRIAAVGIIAGIISFILYFFNRITLLKIEYAGGAIGFDIKWFSEQESLEYQKSLFLAKDKILEGEK